jgi:hypothetical protein
MFAGAGDCPNGEATGQVVEYDLVTRVTSKVSGTNELCDRYPAIEAVVN